VTVAGTAPKYDDVVQSDLSVLVIIPTYQEAPNIENILLQLRAACPNASVLVVDDNSPDGTADIVEKVAEKIGHVSLLRRAAKSGLGSAYRAGFAYGLELEYDVMVEMDADLSHDPQSLPGLLQIIEDGADLAVGSRYVPGGAIPGWSAHRALLSRFGNMYAKAMLHLDVNDATSGYRAYRAAVLAEIDLSSVRADGYGFQIEMAYRVARVGGTVREFPITFLDRTEGQSKMSSRIIVEALWLVTLWGVRDRLSGIRRSSSGVGHNG